VDFFNSRETFQTEISQNFERQRLKKIEVPVNVSIERAKARVIFFSLFNCIQVISSLSFQTTTLNQTSWSKPPSVSEVEPSFDSERHSSLS